MKKVFFSAIIVFLFIACRANEEDINIYFIEFQLSESDGNTNKIYIIQESPQTLTGNGIKNSDSVAVGFGILESFVSPNNKDVTQLFGFRLSMLIAEEELNTNSGTYKFKNSSSFVNHIPLGNLFEEKNIDVNTTFNEDSQTFCSALLDTTFDNNFTIAKTRFYVD